MREEKIESWIMEQQRLEIENMLKSRAYLDIDYSAVTLCLEWQKLDQLMSRRHKLAFISLLFLR